MPDQIVPPPLSPSARRALAASMIGTETRLPGLCSALLADALDAVSAALLAAAGVTDRGVARAVLASLWAHDGNGLSERDPGL